MNTALLTNYSVNVMKMSCLRWDSTYIPEAAHSSLYIHVHGVHGVPPEAAHSSFRKVTALGVLCCFALFVCLTLLVFSFLPSFSSLIKTCTCALFVCLTLLASSFLPSHLSLKHVHVELKRMAYCCSIHVHSQLTYTRVRLYTLN